MIRDNATRRAARRAYVEEGRSLQAIGEALGVASRTVWRWKDEAAAAGDDWMAARRAARRNPSPVALGAIIEDMTDLERSIAASIGADASVSASEKVELVAKLAASSAKLQSAMAGSARLMLACRVGGDVASR